MPNQPKSEGQAHQGRAGMLVRRKIHCRAAYSDELRSRSGPVRACAKATVPSALTVASTMTVPAASVAMARIGYAGAAHTIAPGGWRSEGESWAPFAIPISKRKVETARAILRLNSHLGTYLVNMTNFEPWFA
jgi:hypothetical protein